MRGLLGAALAVLLTGVALWLALHRIPGWYRPVYVPQVRLDPSRMTALGWQTQLSSDEAVARAVGELLKQD